MHITGLLRPGYITGLENPITYSTNNNFYITYRREKSLDVKPEVINDVCGPELEPESSQQCHWRNDVTLELHPVRAFSVIQQLVYVAYS